MAQATGSERGMLAKTSGDEYYDALAVKTIVHVYILQLEVGSSDGSILHPVL